MHVYKNVTLGLLVIASIAACSKQSDPRVSVGLSDDEGDSELAEAIFCTATSDELRNYSNPFNGEVETWQATFEEIYQSAQKRANAFKSIDGAAVETRLNTISAQTKTTLAHLVKTNDSEGFTTFVQQSIQQCASFAS